MSLPRIAVIVLSWNGLPLLKKFLPGVVATDWPNLEIVLADNASEDGSAEWVRSTFPDVRIIRHPENWGYCRGNNEAIRQTSSDYVVLLNNDVEVPADWLSPLVELAESDPRIAAVQPKLLQHEDRGMFEYAGAAGGHLDRLGYPFARGRILFDIEPDIGQYDDPTDIFWATGAALLLRRSSLDEVGLLDEAFEFHMEEIDLCWRLQRAGYRIVCEPSAQVYHVGGGSLPRGDVRKTYYNFRNSLLMLYKNLPPSHWYRLLPQRAMLDMAALARFVTQGSWKEAFAILRAYYDAHFMKAKYHPPTSAEALPRYRGSIVYDYYVRRNRTFDTLSEDRFADPPPTNLDSRAPARLDT